MKVESGTTNKYVYFYAVDATDFTTPETGLTATSPTFRVYRSRNGAAAAAMTTPTINETDPTNMPGVYELLLDEDTTIGAGNDSEEMVLHISHDAMAPVVRTVELYRPKITVGETIGVSSGAVSNVTLVATTTTNTDMRGTDGANTTAPDNASIAAILTDTGTTIPAQIAALNNLSAAQVNAEVDTALADYDGPTKAELDAGFAALNDFDPVNDVVANVTLVGTCTTNTDMRGTDGANTTAPDNASIAAILVDTGTTIPAQISALSIPTATQNADALLNRDMSAVTVTNSRSPINALRFLRNKWSVTGTTLTVTAEDDSTSAWSATLTTDAAADPVTGSDPS